MGKLPAEENLGVAHDSGYLEDVSLEDEAPEPKIDGAEDEILDQEWQDEQ